MTVYSDIDSMTGDVQLRFSLSGPNVRVTRRAIDPFDSDLDTEEIVGDFRLDTLRSRLDVLGNQTGAIPVQGQPQPRARWWR